MRACCGLGRQHAARILDDQRNADALLVCARALASEPVRGAVLAVVGGEHDHRVGGHLGLALERVENPADVPVHLALQLGVEVDEFQPPAFGSRTVEGDGPERRRGSGPAASAAARACAGRSAARASRSSGGSAADHAGGCGLGGDAVAPGVPPGDVVGVHERDRRAPGPRAALFGEPACELLARCAGPPASPGRERRRAKGRSRRRSRSRSSARAPPRGCHRLSWWVRCHLPYQRVS